MVMICMHANNEIKNDDHEWHKELVRERERETIHQYWFIEKRKSNK